MAGRHSNAPNAEQIERYTEDAQRKAQREKQVVELRLIGLTFVAIGQRLGCSAGQACKDYQAAMRSVPVQSVDEHRALAVERAEWMFSEAARVILASRPKQNPDGTMTAGYPDRILRALDRAQQAEIARRQILGLDAPTRKLVEVIDDAAILRVIGELDLEYNGLQAETIDRPAIEVPDRWADPHRNQIEAIIAAHERKSESASVTHSPEANEGEAEAAALERPNREDERDGEPSLPNPAP